jgi:hypothetical protein
MTLLLLTVESRPPPCILKCPGIEELIKGMLFSLFGDGKLEEAQI